MRTLAALILTLSLLARTCGDAGQCSDSVALLQVVQDVSVHLGGAWGPGPSQGDAGGGQDAGGEAHAAVAPAAEQAPRWGGAAPPRPGGAGGHVVAGAVWRRLEPPLRVLAAAAAGAEKVAERGAAPWWTSRPVPWLTSRALVGAWSLLAGCVVMGQLVVMSWAPARGKEARTAPPDGEDLGSAAKELLGQQGSDDQQGAVGVAAAALMGRRPPGRSGPPAEGAATERIFEDFQARWAHEVAAQGAERASLLRVLCGVVGWSSIGLMALLVVWSFVANSVLTVLSVELLLGYQQWFAVHGAVLPPDPFYSCLMVLAACSFVPLQGAIANALLRLQDGRASSRLITALAMAVHHRAQQLPRAPGGSASPEGVPTVGSIEELCRDSVRTALQCAAAPPSLCALLALLWPKMGAAAALVVVGLLPLILLAARHLRGIAEMKVARQVAAQRRHGLWRGLLAGLPAVRCHGWEGPLVARLRAARAEELASVRAIHTATQHVAAVGTVWPRLSGLLALAAYALLSPTADGQAVFSLLLVLSYAASQLSTLAIGASRLASRRAALARLEAFLLRPDAQRAPPAAAAGAREALGAPENTERKEALRRVLPSSAVRPAWAPAPGPPAGAEEPRARAPRGSIFQYLHALGAGRFASFAVLALGSHLSLLLADASLARWAGETAAGPGPSRPAPHFWLWTCGACWGLAACLGAAGSHAGAACSCSLSDRVHSELVGVVVGASPVRVLRGRAPLELADRFSEDLDQVDLGLWVRAAGLTSALCGLMCPLAYVHSAMPPAFSLVALPFYLAIWLFARAFGESAAQLQRECQERRRRVHALVSGVQRAAAPAPFAEQKAQRSHSAPHAVAIGAYVGALFAAHSAGTQRLILRLGVCLSCVYTTVVLVATTSPGTLDHGTFGLTLVFCVLVLQSLERAVEPCAGAEQDPSAVWRLSELLTAPPEAAAAVSGDPRAVSRAFEVDTRVLGQLSAETDSSGVLRVCSEAGQALLRAAEDDQVLVIESGELAGGATGDPAPGGSGERIVAINDVGGDARCMAEELCAMVGPMTVLARDGWLWDGAHLEVRDLCAGYYSGEDVVRSVTFQVAPRQKVAVAGGPGSGKSSLLLALARLLEPRRGSVALGGVDVSRVGLGALRSALGLVPREPAVLPGTLRFNMDPGGSYTDAHMLLVLRSMRGMGRLADDPESLDREVGEGGRSLSPAEQRLLSVARMALRQPPLLLVDAGARDSAACEDAVHDAIHALFPRSTVLVVAHRPELLSRCDGVLTLEKGELVPECARQ